MLHAYYDCIVVGAGISGLVAAIELKKEHPSWSIALAERYKGFGGRTYSYWPPGFDTVHWEMGAGRIHTSHTRTMELVRKYGLKWVPISSTSSYKASGADPIVPNTFESELIPLYIDPLRLLEPSTLATHTLESLMHTLYGTYKTREILGHFPYKAEVTTLRADLALKAFLEGGEMGSNAGYGILAEGFSTLVERLKTELESNGCTMLPRHQLVDLQKSSAGATDLTFRFGYDTGTIVLRATKRVVLALHRDAIAELPPFRSWSILHHLKAEPLLRTYMIFDTSKGPVWFSDLERIVTPQRPRYILPMNPKQGTIMISYTDGDDTYSYSKYKDPAMLEKVILRDIRALFPDRTIPNPIYFKAHPWDLGATYWLPGSYVPEKESIASIHPFPSKLPNVWLCGESWSMRQAWVEGALEQTYLCLQAMKKVYSK